MAKETFDLSRIPSVPRSSEVERQLLRAIESGTYPAGSRLPPERVLAERFGVSRVSVRAALQALAARRIIETSQGRGSFVRETPSHAFEQGFRDWLVDHSDEVTELLEVRGVLEELASSRAATDASKASRQEVEQAHERFLAAIRSGDVREINDADLEFHGRIADASGIELLGHLLHELQQILHEERRALFALREREWADSASEHAEILDAIRLGDAEHAAAATHRHVAATVAALQKEISTQHLPASDAGEGTARETWESAHQPRTQSAAGAHSG